MSRSLKRAAAALAITAALAGAGYWGYGYWTVGRFLETTDDAYLKADYTTIAPKVSGYVAEVLVEDNQPVKADQVLARIDDRDFRTALDQAKADVASAAADIDNLDAQVTLQQAVIDQANADIASAEAALGFARQDDSRYHALMKSGYGTVRQSEQAEAVLREKSAELQHGRAALVAARKQIAVLRTARAKAETTLTRNQAIARQAELNLGYTTIAAPIAGTVGARSLRVGQFVQAGTALMAVVPLQSIYVVANFKETQLTAMRAGQPVTVEVDSFPGVRVTGHVDSLSPASGLEFSLLPPDNATGNFTKIVQRIPVKIVLDSNSPLQGLLRPGMSVESVVDTAGASAGTPVAPRLASN
jgi:membrane fusion protein (multidrug efflux system)